MNNDARFLYYPWFFSFSNMKYFHDRSDYIINRKRIQQYSQVIKSSTITLENTKD